MSSVKVSVIMPMYNVEEYIGETIKSVINQTLDNIEIILIDDNSIDKTFSIASMYAEKYPNIKLIKQPKNLGSAAARNYGMRIANGQYIFFIDDDDFIEKDSLRLMYNAAVENDSDLITGIHKLYIEELDKYIDADMFNTFPSLGQKGFKQINNNPELFYLIYCWGKLYKKELIEKITFPNLSNAQDMPFTFNAYIDAEKIYTIDTVVYYYRRRGRNSSSVTQKIYSNPDKYLQNFIEVINIASGILNDKNNNKTGQSNRYALYIYFVNRVISRDIYGVLFPALKSNNNKHKLKILQVLNNWILSINSSLLLDASSFQVMIKDINKFINTFNIELTNCYLELLRNAKTKMEINTFNSNIKVYDKVEKRQKMVFFSKGDDKFLHEILEYFQSIYEVKKIIVRDAKQIDEGMEWADICWFEWCDELIIYGSNLAIAHKKKIICRLHSYEAFTQYVKKVNWGVVDKVIFVSDYIRDFALESEPKLQREKTVVIPNGVNLEKYKYKERNTGFKIAYVGYLNFKKGPMLLLHSFKQIVDFDNRYSLHIAGEFQEIRYLLYYKQMIKEMNLEKHVFIDEWQKDINTWLEDKSYILTSSVLESQHMAVMEAMAKGIKPLIHNFVGARNIYKDEYIWTSQNEIIDLLKRDYNSFEYRKFIEEKYSLNEQLETLLQLIKSFKSEKTVTLDFSYDNKEIKFNITNPKDHIQKYIYFHKQFYELGMLEDIKQRINEKSVVIDIGSNIGNHTVFMGLVCNAYVYAFEPQPEAYELLEKNVKLNKLDSKVKLFNMALGESEGLGKICNYSNDNMGAAQVLVQNDGDIYVNSLDNVLEGNVKAIDILKIDVEGMELNVLKGARKVITQFKPVIYIETKDNNEFNIIYSFLKQFGYEPKKRFNHTPTILFEYNTNFTDEKQDLMSP